MQLIILTDFSLIVMNNSGISSDSISPLTVITVHFAKDFYISFIQKNMSFKLKNDFS